jgi:hypothetical protein
MLRGTWGRMRSFTGGLVGATLLIGALPAVASAGCPAGSTSQPFFRWLDLASYSQVPGGSFESGTTGWSLTNAKVVNGNESYSVQGGMRSLSLKAGAVAVSPSFCLDITEPTFRFFDRASSGSASPLRLSLMWTDMQGETDVTPVGFVSPTSSWEPSPVMLLDLALPLSLLESTLGSLSVRLVYETGSAGEWHLDDAYYDPYARR